VFRAFRDEKLCKGVTFSLTGASLRKMRTTAVVIFIILTGFALPLHAQDRLTLEDAVQRTLDRNPAVSAYKAAEDIAASGVDQARAAWFPRVDYVEAWQRSDQPVFVFGSLLAQSRFGPANFAFDALNNPDPLNNFRGALTVQQSLVDLARPARIKAAASARDSAALGTAALKRDLALGATRAYGQVLVAATARRAAQSALDAAEEDRARADHRREAGLATDADVLSFQVHAAGMRARLAQAVADETIARTSLNELMGEPLDATFTLDDLAGAPPQPATDLATLEREALQKRELVKQAALQEQAAGAQHDIARSAFLPSAGFQAGYEFDGQDWSGRQRWWAAGVEVRWNLFNGLSDKAKLAAAQASIAQARAGRARTENAIRVEVRSAVAHLEAAVARDETGRAAVLQAREAQRIIRERYEAGMAGVTDVLRAANALYDAELQQRTASVDVFIAQKTLESVVGR
jgi:outer membrane protein TolC